MPDGINIEAKSDRELLIMAISKINEMDEKLDGVCGNIVDHDDKINNLEPKLKVLEDRADTQKSINFSILIVGIAFISNAILSWLRIK